MSGTDIEVFNFKGNDVRIVTLDGDPWWVARDVCAALEISNVGNVLDRLDMDERDSIRIPDGNRGNPVRAIVNEPGLYSLILRSSKPQAREFKRWVTHEVLPSIRKTGGYGRPAPTASATASVDLEAMATVIGTTVAAAVSEAIKPLLVQQAAIPAAPAVRPEPKPAKPKWQQSLDEWGAVFPGHVHNYLSDQLGRKVTKSEAQVFMDLTPPKEGSLRPTSYGAPRLTLTGLRAVLKTARDPEESNA